MPTIDSILHAKTALLAAKGQQRRLHAATPLEGMWIEKDDKRLLNFASNDYFGLSRHADVIAAAQAATVAYGTGAGASRLVSGNHPPYAALESSLARMKSTESALVFGSGYLASISIIPAIVGKPDLILADKLIHACMLDGARLSGATLLRFAHNNSDHARQLLETHRADTANCLILTETVFSMDGDRGNVSALCDLAKEFDAWVMTDDAHGLGMGDWGLRNQGINHRNPSLPSPIPHLQMGTLSKGAGTYGGYVCASKTVIDYLITSARGFIFSTGLPPATIAAATKALALLEHDETLVERPLTLARRFTDALGLPSPESPIVPVILGENEAALAAAAALEAEGFFVAAIRPPTVPPGTARLRFTFSALHREEEIDRLSAAIQRLNLLTAEAVPA